MIFNINKWIMCSVLMTGLLFVTLEKGVAQDSLSLSSVIREVTQNHPMVKKAMEELNTSEAKIGFAESGYLPNVDFTSSYSRIGPVSEITIPEMGTFSFTPKNNYSAAFSVNQTLYDFGKTERNILFEKQGKELSLQSVEQVKQKLSQGVIAHFFALVYLQEALEIKHEQLNTLNEHLLYVQKKMETGSATQYEILTTQVRISTIENQKTDLETARRIQVCQLNSLLGLPESKEQCVKKELNLLNLASMNDSLLATAMKNRDELKLAAEKTKLAELRYSLTSSQNNAVFNAFLTGGVKDGYSPKLNEPKANFVAGVGVRIPVFDGYRNHFNLVQAQSAIELNHQETEITRRSIVNEVVESEANVKASGKKVEQCELQLKQATQAYALAQVRFESGVITNLELLDGETAISESQLQLLRAKIDYTVSLYKLKAAVGERLY